MIESVALALKLIMFVWAGDVETGYERVSVFLTNDPATDCNRRDAPNGCVLDVGIIVIDPHLYDPRGCTLLTHEWLHVMGLEERDLPYCPISQEFRK